MAAMVYFVRATPVTATPTGPTTAWWLGLAGVAVVSSVIGAAVLHQRGLRWARAAGIALAVAFLATAAGVLGILFLLTSGEE
jgi:hypothetical protein